MSRSTIMRVNVQPFAGSTFSEVANECIQLCKDNKFSVMFKFNGIEINVDKLSCSKDIWDMYLEKQKYSNKG